MNIGNEELARRFGEHSARIEGPVASPTYHRDLRVYFLEFAEYLNAIVPDGREKALAFTHLEEASMWAHKANAWVRPVYSPGHPHMHHKPGYRGESKPWDRPTREARDANPESETEDPTDLRERNTAAEDN